MIVAPPAPAVMMFVPLVESVSPPLAVVVVPAAKVMLPPLELSVTPLISLKPALAEMLIGPPVVRLKELGVPPIVS